MHMKELPMFTYNLWMDCLHPDKLCQLFCPVINIAMSNNLNTLMCTLHIFSSDKARFIHTRTVTILHSCSGKKYAYALRACFYIKSIFLNIFKTKYTTKGTSVSWCSQLLLGACPQPCSKREDTVPLSVIVH